MPVSEHPEDDRQSRWMDEVQQRSSTVQELGVLLPAEWPLPQGFSGIHFAWGSWDDDQELAQRLFAGLRTLDAMGADVILCPLPPERGLGSAIRDRLLKAAREK